VERIGKLGTLAVTGSISLWRASTASHCFVPSSPVLVTQLMEATHSSEKSVLTRAIRRHIAEADIQHRDRRENLKSYKALTGWDLSQRTYMFPVRYEQGFYIPEDGIPDICAYFVTLMS
jgi:hypothetical protein